MHRLTDMQESIEYDRILCRLLLMPRKSFRKSDEKSCSAKLENKDWNNTPLMHNFNHQHCMTLHKFQVICEPQEHQWSNVYNCQQMPAKKYYLNILSCTAKPLTLSPLGTQQGGHVIHWGNPRTAKQNNLGFTKI